MDSREKIPTGNYRKAQIEGWFLINKEGQKSSNLKYYLDIEGDKSEKIAVCVLDKKTLMTTRGVKENNGFFELGETAIQVSNREEVIIVRGDIEHIPTVGAQYDFVLSLMTKNDEWKSGKDYTYLGICKSSTGFYDNCHIFQRNWYRAKQGGLIYEVY